MTFGAPLGLLALAAVPLLVGLYFLRRRAAPRRVSALFLWRSPDDISEGGRTWRRMSRELSLLLECVAVVAAAAALADLRCDGGAGSASHSVLVLDSSLSMRAVSGGESAFTRARGVIENGSHDGVFTIIDTHVPPRMLAGPGASWTAAHEAISAWDPSGPSSGFDSALALAKEVAGASGAITLVTDSVVAVPEGIGLIATGVSLGNVGFVEATRRDRDGRADVTLRVRNFQATTAAVPIELLVDGAVVRTESLSLGPDASATTTLTMETTSAIQARIPVDSLIADNAVELPPAPAREVRVENRLGRGTAAGEAVARFLGAADGVSRGAPADLSFVTPGTSVDGWSVVIGAFGEAKDRRSFVGPFFAEPDSPLVEGVATQGLVWSAGAAPGGHAVWSTSDRALVAIENGLEIRLNLDVARSNVTRTEAWPLLLANVLALRRASLPGFGRSAASLGDRVAVATGPDGGRLVTPSSERRIAPGTMAIVVDEAGVWTLAGDDARQDRLVVNAIAPGESDLRLCAEATIAPRASIGGGRAGDTVSRLPLLLFLAALMLDFLLAAPGVRRRVPA